MFASGRLKEAAREGPLRQGAKGHQGCSDPRNQLRNLESSITRGALTVFLIAMTAWKKEGHTRIGLFIH